MTWFFQCAYLGVMMRDGWWLVETRKIRSGLVSRVSKSFKFGIQVLMTSRDSDTIRLIFFVNSAPSYVRNSVNDPWSEDGSDIVIRAFHPKQWIMTSPDGHIQFCKIHLGDSFYYGNLTQGLNGLAKLEHGNASNVCHDMTDCFLLYLSQPQPTSSSVDILVYPKPKTVTQNYWRTDVLPLLRKWSLPVTDANDVQWVLSRHTPRVFGYNTKLGMRTEYCILTGSIRTRPCVSVPEHWRVVLPHDDHELWTGTDAVYSSDGIVIESRSKPDPAAVFLPMPDGGVMIFSMTTPGTVDIIRRPLHLRRAWIGLVLTRNR